MRSISMSCLAIMVLLFSTIVPALAQEAGSAQGKVVPAGELEKELTGIERDLSDLEKEIDTLLEDLVDPKITSMSVFFSSSTIRGRVPASVQIHMDGNILATKEFTQTDRLVLVRGGAIEVYSGIADPVSHNLTVECFLVSGEVKDDVLSTGKAAFKFEASRSRANFLEIMLTEDPAKKPVPYNLSVRHWSKEP